MAKSKKLTSGKSALLESDFEELNTHGSAFDESELEEESVLESGAQFWRFEDDPEVIATYIEPVIAREDNGDQWSKGDTIGYLFHNKNGAEFIVPANYAIAQALQNAERGQIYKIRFLGKETRDGGRQFSRFRIVRMKRRGDK